MTNLPMPDWRQARRDDLMTVESLLEDSGLPDDEGADTLTENPRVGGSTEREAATDAEGARRASEASPFRPWSPFAGRYKSRDCCEIGVEPKFH